MTAAQHAMAEGNYQLAAKRLVYARDAEPRNAAVLRLMTLAFWQGGDLEAAGRAVRDWARVEGERPAPHRFAARIYEDMGALDLAEEAAERAALRAPNDADAWERVGRLRLRLMDRAGAIEALERARRLGPSVEGLLDLALAFHLAGDLGGEVTACEQATFVDGESAAAWSRYAHALARTDRVSDAIAAADRALDLDPDDEELAELLERLRARPARAARRLTSRSPPRRASLRFPHLPGREPRLPRGVRSARSQLQSPQLAAEQIPSAQAACHIRTPAPRDRAACSPAPASRQSPQCPPVPLKSESTPSAPRRPARSIRRPRSAPAGCARSCAGTRSSRRVRAAGTPRRSRRSTSSSTAPARATSRCSSSSSAAPRGRAARPTRSCRRATRPTSAASSGSMTARYSGRIAAWEIWNEPDEAEFWHAPFGAASYAPMLRAAHSAVKAADPAALVLAGASTGNDYAFLEGLYAAGAGDAFDGVAVAHRHRLLDRLARPLLPRGRPRRALQLPRLPRDARRARSPRPG